MTELKKTWQRVGDKFYLRDISQNEHPLKRAIYTVELCPESGQLYLKLVANEFKFDFKIYGLEEHFINRVLKTYKNTTGNLGMILNGVKGTGKTITGEI